MIEGCHITVFRSVDIMFRLIGYIKDIIVYLKNAKKSKDSMAEELICISLFSIFELIHGSTRNTYILYTWFGAVARMIRHTTSYPDELKQFKNINAFTMIQYMIKEEIITSKTQALNSMKKLWVKESN